MSFFFFFFLAFLDADLGIDKVHCCLDVRWYWRDRDVMAGMEVE